MKKSFEVQVMKKTVVITGGSGAIGAACVKLFMQKGYNVAAGYLNNEIKDIEESGSFAAVKADISDMRSAKKLIDTAADKFGSVDVLINNAAISEHGLFQNMTCAAFDRITDVNIKGTFYTSQAAAKYMIHNHSGCIINISSMWGQTGASCEAAYSMTKAAVIGFTKALAKELGPSGIRVNCISPGLIDTPMNSCYSEEDLEAIVDETPLMRMGTPVDVANAALFLAGESSSFVTGQIIGVNGGYLI